MGIGLRDRSQVINCMSKNEQSDGYHESKLLFLLRFLPMKRKTQNISLGVTGQKLFFVLHGRHLCSGIVQNNKGGSSILNSLYPPPVQAARAFQVHCLRGEDNLAEYRDQHECQRKLSYQEIITCVGVAKALPLSMHAPRDILISAWLYARAESHQALLPWRALSCPSAFSPNKWGLWAVL